MHLLSYSNCTKHSLRHFYPPLYIALSLSLSLPEMSHSSVFCHFIIFSFQSWKNEHLSNFDVVHDWIHMLSPSLYLSLCLLPLSLSFMPCVRKSIFRLARINPSSLIVEAGWIIEHALTHKLLLHIKSTCAVILWQNWHERNIFFLKISLFHQHNTLLLHVFMTDMFLILMYLFLLVTL